MKIICAGFPKTGTKSMANALNHLGYSVHDLEEHLEYSLDNYLRFFDGDIGDEVFTEMYGEVDAVVDMPASILWNILHQKYPEAKVILMERETPEAWFRSFLGMANNYRLNFLTSSFLVLMSILSNTHSKLHQMFNYMFRMCSTTTLDDILRNKFSKSIWIDQYRRHNAAVKATVPSPQLLVYRVSDGWEPLCQFLETEVPAIPFPHENKAGQPGNIVEKFHKFAVYRKAVREVRNSIVTCFSVTVAVFAFIYILN